MPPNDHALLSASSSHRWLHCNPSARLEREFADRESVAAAEGTAAHALAEQEGVTFQAIYKRLALAKKNAKKFFQNG